MRDEQVRQYKLERECNAILQQSREEKIARMESLVDGILPVEDFCTDEWNALQLEHKVSKKLYINTD
jgi:kinesin family protein 15